MTTAYLCNVHSTSHERSQFVQMLLSVKAGREINEEVFACESNKFPLQSPREEECTLEVYQIYSHALNLR